VATGRRHAAVVSNCGDLEAAAVRAGLESGDLVHPLPYCPEFYSGEFKSKVADMKNSVKDRMNAQASCAGQFIANHLGDFKGKWLHIDIAGPTMIGGLGTGYGVALMIQLFNQGLPREIQD
jgi:probable aminopeptidase NPEPL1